MSYLRQSLALVVGSVFALSAAAAEPDLMALVLSKEYWSSFKWEAAGRSDLWRMRGWRPGAPEDASGWKTHKTRDVLFEGWELSVAVSSRPAARPTPLLLKVDATFLSRAQCLDLARRFSASLGTPVENEITSYTRLTEQLYMKTDLLGYQWDIGETRITAMCVALFTSLQEGADRPVYAWEANFQHISTAEKLVPKFAVTCRPRMIPSDGDEASGDGGVQFFWIDPMSREVLTQDFTSVAFVEGVEGDIVRFKHYDGRQVLDYVLDTASGRLVVEVSEGGTHVATVSGECTRVADPKPIP